jgi:hypothetical protein
MAITSIDYVDNKILINRCVLFWIEGEEPKAQFDKNTIKEMDAFNLIDEYVKKILEKL